MDKIITTEVYQLHNDKKLDISLAVTRSHKKINNSFAIYLDFQIGMEFRKRKLMTDCRKMPDHRTLWNNILLFLQEWFDTRKTDDSICIDDRHVIYTDCQVKEVLLGYGLQR